MHTRKERREKQRLKIYKYIWQKAGFPVNMENGGYSIRTRLGFFELKKQRHWGLTQVTDEKAILICQPKTVYFPGYKQALNTIKVRMLLQPREVNPTDIPTFIPIDAYY